MFVLLFGANIYSVFHGLAGGSADFAKVDLAAGTVLWLVVLATVALVFRNEVRRIDACRSGPLGGRAGPPRLSRRPATDASRRGPDVHHDDPAC